MRPLLSRLLRPPAHLPLGTFPSPLEHHPALAAAIGARALLIKRDDLNGIEFGGNKLRALEFLLPRMGPAVVTMGGYGSTWCAALATAAARTHTSVHAALFPQPWTERVAGVMARTLAGARVQVAHSRRGLPAALFRAWRGASRRGRPRWLPAGGAEPLGVLGSVNAALEFAAQVDGLRMPRPDAIVVPLGSCGTAAGLLVGCWLLEWPVEICAVRVTDPWFAHRRRVLRLAARTLRLLHSAGLSIRPGRAGLRVIPGELGAGYGHPTPAGAEAVRSFAVAGITLDPTYGAKAAAALGGLAASFPVLCFWHTFDARLESPPVAEDALLREARFHAESLWPHLKST